MGTPSGTRVINLRMPGQYFDSESDLFYNWNRYYNPAIGRYVSSDPIGLGGGLNTFSYAEASPVMYTDPEGKMAVAGVEVVVVIGTVTVILTTTDQCDVACTQALAQELASSASITPNGMTYAACMAILYIKMPLVADEKCRAFADNVCPPASAPGAGDSNTVERQGPIPGAEAEDEENRCKEVLETCREICHLDGEVIGTGSDTLGEYRKCVRLCMEEAQCYNF